MWANGRLSTGDEEARQTHSLNVQAAELANALLSPNDDILPSDEVQNTLKQKQSKARRLSETDGVIKISVQQVMEDQFAPPFSMKDFHRYLEKDQCDENSCFYSTLKTYERLCETIPSQHLYHANQSLDIADQLQLDKARRMMAALIDRFFIIGAEKELNVPANLLKPLLSQVNEKHNIHPEVFQGVLENIFAMLRLSSFPNFYKEASMKGALRPKVTVLQILEDQCRPPMSFNDFYQFLKREHSEENIEFYKALKEYKQICIDIPAEVLKNSDIPVSDIVVQDNLIKAKDKLLFIMKTFFEEQSKYDLNVPVLLKKPFFNEVNVKKNIHPDVFDGILQNVLAMLKLSSFPNFQKEVEKTQKSLQETTEDISQITPTVSLSPSLVAPPLLNRKTKSNVSFNSTISPKPDIRLSIKSLLNPTLRPQSVSGSSSSCGHEKAVSPRDTEFTPKINIQEVLEDEFLPPFSLKDFVEFLHAEHSEENIEFYLALREYIQLCSDVPEDLLRNASPAFVEASDTLKLASVAMAVVQILDRFFAKGAKHELNIPSNISKALVLSINKRKNIHPEVFNDAMENVLQMLKLSSFPNFYKSALAKGEIKERTEENEYERSHESFIEPILNIPDVRKFSTNNIFQKLETWSVGANAPGSKESFHGSGIFETKSTASQHSLTSIKAPTLAAKGKRRASTIADINTVLEDGYSKPYSLDDFQSFLKAEHSEENIQYYMALQEYKTLCKKVPSAILHDVSCIPQDSPFSGHIGKIVSSMNQMLEIYFTNDATTELNIPSKLLKPFLAAVREKHNFHPDIFKPITENVLLMMKLSSFPNFQKLASSKGSLELKLTVKQVLDDQHPSPMSLNDFHNFMIRENDEAKIGFYLACKEFEDLCEKIGKDEETPQETSGHDLNQLSQAQNKRNNIMQLYISEGAKYDLKLPADLQNAITADSSWNPKIFDPVVDHILTVLKESVFPLFLREVQGSNRKQRESELSQTQSYSEKRSASASSTEFKPTVLQVLEDKCESPFSLNDFHQFIINEHSEENYDFYMAVKDHQYHCERISPDILRDVSQLKIGTPDWFKVEPLKQAIDSIRSKFLSPGSDTELNIPAKIMKPLLAHLDGKKTIHPEIFDAAVDNVLTMMRLSSFPVFCKSASAKGPARLKATLLAVLEDEVQSPHSLQEFREYLQTQNLEGNIKFFFWLQTYQELCSKIPKPLLLKCDEALIDDVHFVSVENAKAEISVALESFFGADGSIRVAAPIKAGIVEAIKKHSNICPDVFDPALAAVMTQLKTSFNQFQKDIHGRNSKSAMTKIIASQENAQPRNSETTWGDMVAFTKLLSRPKTAVSKASESEKDVKSELNSDIKSEPSPTVKQTGVLNDVESKRSSNRISGLSDFKPTVLQVLEDQLCPPFSQQDFHAFIINEHSEENYDFYMAVKSYQELCEKIPEELLKDSSESANEFLMPKIERAKEAIAAIHLKFLTPGSDTELNIPAKILNPLRLELQEKKNIHPEIFTDALDNVLTMMRLSSFPVFCKSASAKGDPKLKPTIQQVLDDLLPPPLSRKDFYEFLKKEHSEENYEFYMSLKNYERQCAEIPTELLKNSAEVDASDSYYSSILSAKSAVNEMMATFFVTDGKFELNIPIHLKNTLKDEINVKANIHPDLFQDILGSILMAWRFSSFPNFQKEATSLPAVQPPELTISGIGTDSSSADSPAGECSRLSPNLLSKQRPKSWAANLMGGRKLSFSKVAVGDEMKATVQEIWDNEFAPPFSLKDYEKYLVDEGDTAALEFYKSLIEYRKLCQTIPDEQLRNSKAYKDSQLSTAFFSVIQMLAKFFARGAKQDIKVPADTLKVLLAQVNEKRNIHPEVFQEALEFVLTQQKLVHFPNFYTLASAKGSLRLSKKKSPKQEESMSKPLFARGRRLSSSAGKLDGALCKKIAESGLDQSSSLKNIDALQVKQATNTKSDPAMELRGENEEGGQAASFAGYSNVPTSPVVPRLKRASSLTKPGRVSENHRSKLDQLEDSVRMSVHRSSVAGLSKPSKTRRSSILADADNGIKFGVLQVLEDQFSPPFSMKDFHRFLIREYSDENIDFYLALKEFRRICEYIPGDQLRGDSEALEQMDESEQARLMKIREGAKDIVSKFFTLGGERELNVPSNILKPLLVEVKQKQNVHPDVFKAALDNVLTMLRLSSFPNFYKQAIEKGPITLKYTLQQVLDDTLHPPVSLKDFHNFLVRDHSEENIEFYIAFRRYQAMCDKVPAPVLTGQSKEVPDSALFEACKNALSDIIARFVSPKAPQELNVPRNLRNTVIAETEKRNIHPEIFKEVLENVVTMLKLSSFPKFQKEVQVQVNVDDSIAVKSPGTLTAPNEIPEDVKNLILEIADTSSRVSITHRILTRLGLTSFVFDDPTDSSSTRDRISSFWKVSGEANSDVQFADMVTPAQLKLGLQQTLDDKIPPPLSCRDFRTYLKKEKKAHYVDFYLAVKKYRRLCEKVPEGILNNPSNASVTSPTQLPANSPIARIKTELNEIISKYCEPESKFYVQLTPQIKLFLNSEVNKNGNWTPHIFEGAINHVCMTMQRSSFPGFYKMATTKAKGVKLKIVGTKKTSKGVNVEARISEEVKEGDDEERDDLLDIEAPESLTAGKLSNLLFQVLADKTSPPLSRNDFYLYLKKEHSEENFDFYMSIVNYRKICKTGDQDDIKLAAYKIIETFLLSNGNREICITSKVKTAILKSVETDNNFDPNIFNAAFLEVLSILRVSSFPSFISENSKDSTDEAGLNTIVPDDLNNEPVESDITKGQDPLIVQVLQNRLSPPLSLADFYNYLILNHSEKDLEFILLMEHYRKKCKDIPDFVLRNGVTVHTSRNELAAQTAEVAEKFFTYNHLKLPQAVRDKLIVDLEENGDYHPEVFDDACKVVMDRLKNSSIPAFYTQGLQIEQGW